MINFVSKEKDFLNHKEQFYTHFNKLLFENNPFKENFKYFYAFEFDFIYNIFFFNGLKNFLNKKNINSSIFYTIEPHSEEYFYKYFERYSVLEINTIASYNSFYNILNKDPGNSPADALAINTTEVAWFSHSKEWAILSSRDWEISIIGFSNKDSKIQFLNSFDDKSKTMFDTIKAQVNQLDEMLQFSDSARSEYRKLVANYQDRI